MEKLKVFKKNKTEEKPKSNPMKESDYCFYQSYGEALVGLERALELRRGRIDYVTKEDILDNCDIDPEEFVNVFGEPKSLISGIYEEIKIIFSDAEALLSDMDSKMQLTNILKRLKKNCPMLRVLRLVNDHAIWRENLRKLVEKLAEGWPPVHTPAWEYLYANFCCQFALVLEKWETSDFADSHLEDCIRLIDIWLSADGMLGDTVDKLLDDWSIESIDLLV